MTFVSYAQNYEDLVLWRALKSVEAGFYIDVGAADPQVFSVTYAFYQRGWSGINIEPAAEYFARLSVERTRDVNLQALAGTAPGVSTFFEFASLGLSTMNAPVAQRHIDAGLEYRTVSMPVLPLSSVCEPHGTRPIHFLKIDVEGAEREALLGMDFVKHRPWIIIVEATEPMSPVITRDKWEDVIAKSGYIFAYYDGLNCYYVAPERRELIDVIAVPPNVFDDFIKSDEFELRAKAEDWSLHLIRHGEEIGRLNEQLGEEQTRRSALEADLVVARRTIEQRDNELRRLSSYIAELERHLQAIWVSFSWRVTIPLRSFSRRFPGVSGTLRSCARRHPGLRRLVLLLRSLWRMLRLRSPFSHARIAAVPVPQRIPEHAKNWFFLGDLIEWLEVHNQLTGVGKVTAELFLASLSSHSTVRMLPCALAPTAAGLASIPLRDAVECLISRGGIARGNAAATALVPEGMPPATALTPTAGDHVLFTGVVWTEAYIALFMSLANIGVRFSVFLYDIIPVLNPQFVDPAVATAFTRWLRTALTLAECVFVSSQGIRDQVLRWAALSNVYVSATVVVVELGTSVAGKRTDVPAASREQMTLVVREENFVLSVGTIDHRKNQAFLCRVWQRLTTDLGRGVVPQLVLVGRDDVQLAKYAPARSALTAGDIVVLPGVSDAALANLYRGCQFTVFPSLAEGYGLPVSESHAFGKLCVASDLDVISEHAGDLPWYFPPDDEDSAYIILRRAITDFPARQAAEARIIAERPVRSWTATYDAIAKWIGGAVGTIPPGVLAQPDRLAIPGVAVPPVLPSLALAHSWCTEDDPQVSILIINWNAYQLTRACVQHIWANTSDVSYEIIIVDNGSNSEELRALQALGRGVRLLSLGVNRFFGEACNIAVEHARGSFVCLLNNDCFGQPGWLTKLVEALEADPLAGAAGPLFLFPDQTIQEAGGTINAAGYPLRFGRGETLVSDTTPDYMVAGSVDYISAAALVLRRETYLRAGGFDLRYEPAYYEDADLCYKLRILGLSVKFCADARMIHLEGASANDDPVAITRRNALGDLNRGKFLSRWGRYLQSHVRADLVAIAKEIFINDPPAPALAPTVGRKIAALYTPYPITPGGGERFLLTIASILMQDYEIAIVTPQPYSRLRLLNIGYEFDIDLSQCRPQTEAEFLVSPAPDLMVVVGNHIVPPIRPRTPNSLFICQFPFPMPTPAAPSPDACEYDYRRVIVYSDYVKTHVMAALRSNKMPSLPIEVIYPPVPQVSQRATEKKIMVLSVGRFFGGGHNKRHDLMITAFRSLLENSDGAVEMHLVGSSTPAPEHMEHLNNLIQLAEGIPVRFHVNASRATLDGLYHDSAVYWHATGLGVDLTREPAQAEHFGISLVEAMAAGCVAMAFDAGGPREIITNGVNGLLYRSIGELVTLTADILQPKAASRRRSLGEAAGRRAQDFASDKFAERIRQMLRAD